MNKQIIAVAAGLLCVLIPRLLPIWNRFREDNPSVHAFALGVFVSFAIVVTILLSSGAATEFLYANF